MKLSTKGHHHRPLTGATLALVSMSFFACQDALIKFLSAEYSLLQILFLRSIVVIVPLFFILFYQDGIRTFHTHHPFEHVKRVMFNLSAFLLYYYSLTRIDLAQATAIAMSAPLFMTVLSGKILGESAGTIQKTVVAAGFIGVLLVIQPFSGKFDWLGISSVIGGAVMFAMLVIQTRKMTRTESTQLMVFYAALTIFCLTALFMPSLWVQPVGTDWLLLLSVGVITMFAQLSIVHAYRFAPVYTLAPFEYVTILWALFFGWVIFSEIPTVLMLVGAGIIVACGIVIIQIERQVLPPGKAAH